MFFSPGVKIQCNLSVQSDSKVIVHDAFFRETLTVNKISIRDTISTRLKVVNEFWIYNFYCTKKQINRRP